MYKKHPILDVAFAVLAGAALLPADAVLAGATSPPPEPAGKGATNPHIPPPHGPHFILSVPVELENLPPEIDEYSVACYALNYVPDPSSSVAVLEQSRSASRAIEGTGTASGAIPVGTSRDNRTFKATATVGVFVSFNPNASWTPENVAHRLAGATTYRCDLTLSGTAYQFKTAYLSDTATIPQAPGKPYARLVQGPLPH